jgi:hypothetical protein
MGNAVSSLGFIVDTISFISISGNSLVSAIAKYRGAVGYLAM